MTTRDSTYAVADKPSVHDGIGLDISKPKLNADGFSAWGGRKSSKSNKPVNTGRKYDNHTVWKGEKGGLYIVKNGKRQYLKK